MGAGEHVLIGRAGRDVLTDFTQGEDIIDLSSLGLTTFNDTGSYRNGPDPCGSGPSFIVH